jgi:hypothetical protein
VLGYVIVSALYVIVSALYVIVSALYKGDENDDDDDKHAYIYTICDLTLHPHFVYFCDIYNIMFLLLYHSC